MNVVTPEKLGFAKNAPVVTAIKIASQTEVLKALNTARSVCADSICDVMVDGNVYGKYLIAAVEWSAIELRNAGWNVNIRTTRGSGINVTIYP